MKVSESDLQNKYSELEDFELIILSKKDSLTDEAKEILNREIKKRNIGLYSGATTESIHSCPETRKSKSRIKSAAYGFLSGVLIGSSLLSSSIKNHDPTLIAEIFTRAMIGVFIGIILFAISLFISEKTAKKTSNRKSCNFYSLLRFENSDLYRLEQRPKND